MTLPYNDYGNWIRQRFPFRVQKISIDAGFTCPNRDGRVSKGGCAFCDNRTFNPAYCDRQKSIAQQIAEGKDFFRRKYPDMKFLAYFQAYSNTYAPVETLRRRYEEALSQEDVVGLVIATRPDCVDDEILDYIANLSRQTFVIVEYGIETLNDETLRRMNRGHDTACTRHALAATHERGILTGGHIILGLPGEDREESLRQARLVSALPIDILKLHQLQVIRGTRLARQYESAPFRLYTATEYMELIAQYIQYLRKDIVLERFVSQSPADLLIAPKWGLKNYEFTNLLVGYLEEHHIHQGIIFEE